MDWPTRLAAIAFAMATAAAIAAWRSARTARAASSRAQLPPGVVRMVMTCSECPTQWDVWLTDGSYLYFRYRSSWLSMSVHPTLGQHRAGGEPITSIGVDLDFGELHGSLTDDQVRGALALCLPELGLDL